MPPVHFLDAVNTETILFIGRDVGRQAKSILVVENVAD